MKSKIKIHRELMSVEHFEISKRQVLRKDATEHHAVGAAAMFPVMISLTFVTIAKSVITKTSFEVASPLVLTLPR
jgi:hypothetical protein